MYEPLAWLGIVLCILQSAVFSGLNLGIFRLSRLRLEAAAATGDADAATVLALRQDANFTLATILWGNVAINVLLTLLADSLMAGIIAFLFSTMIITMLCEILPQAYFSQHALRIAARLAVLVRFYQVLLWPIARPVGKLLDSWVGREGIPLYREAELSDILRHHARSAESEVGHLEATGAINFLALDDLPVRAEGEPLDPLSILRLPFQNGLPVFPEFKQSPEDSFLLRMEASGKKWVVITDETDRPHFVMDAHKFLRDAMFADQKPNPISHCQHPLIVDDLNRPLGRILNRLTVRAEGPGDDVIDKDLVIIWTPGEKRIITGADILGRLLRGIVRVALAEASVRNEPMKNGPG